MDSFGTIEAAAEQEAVASPALLDRLAGIVGARHVLTGAADIEPYVNEPRSKWHGAARCVVRPGSTADVAAIAALCNETATALVPQGGNTGLVGGQTPDGSGAQVVLSLTRLDRIRELDEGSATMTVEAGVTLHRAREAADAAGRLFPLSLASEGTCTVGGNLATNAGGTAVLAYGNARQLALGLEVVLADGRVLNALSKLRKDNSGYDVKQMFIGSEGTLGIITAAVLRLFPRPLAVETAFVGLAAPADCLALLLIAQRLAGQDLKTFEFMPRIGLDFLNRHAACGPEPLAGRHGWYVLMELTAHAPHGLRDTMLAVLEEAFTHGVIEDAAVAASEAQRRAFWRWREALPDVQAREGGSIKHDVSLPLAAVPAFLEQAMALVDATIPGARPVPFGHLGDGNVHFNVSQPVGADPDGFLARWDEVNAKVHALVLGLGGSVAAEHGVGVLKRGLLEAVKDPVALALMRTMKEALDPRGILNPGKVIRALP
jgi:FAD/FMN-containing dehydrogenase